MTDRVEITVEANVRWWVKPLAKALQHLVNGFVWLVTKYGVKVRV